MAAMQDDMRDNYFNAYLCHVCKSKESFSHSKVCSACKLISYCGSEHQKADRENHKPFCKAVQKACRRGHPLPFPLPLPSPGDDVLDVAERYFRLERKFKGMTTEINPQEPGNLREVKMMAIEIVETHLSRRMSRCEMNMIYHSKYCAYCFARKNVDKKLVCTNCFSVSYCSTEHQSLDNHEEVCADLRKVLDTDLFMLNVNFKSPEIPLLKPDDASRLKLDALDMQSFIANYIRPGPNVGEEALISFYYTSILTFAYSINRIPNFSLRKRLTVHIVGAQSSVEDLVVGYWENLLHLFPGVKAATIVHIGPNIDCPPIKLNLCDNCSDASRCVEILFYKQSYHEYHYSSYVMKPDVIIAFQSGLYIVDFDTWGPSLPFFFRYDNVPVILTEMHQCEVEYDLERLLSEDVVGDKKVKVVINCEENPFKNLRLWREWSDPDHRVRTKNSYVSALIVESG